ncbi:MAG: cytochrome c biogenesis protein CcdA [Clostridiales bacterium]|jgi:cytochrome c-type biogenesis protein|nr:cytochrome c biogenesis protein CcdA [Clostridiales bacterium]
MQYILLFLEGIITFISPCLLPMLPVYISYFAAGGKDKTKALVNASAFVMGFTFIFVAMGAFMGVFGSFLSDFKKPLNIVAGLIVIMFGLNFLGVLNLGISLFRHKEFRVKNLGFFSSMLFGIVFSIGWTPCVGSFLGSALMVASIAGSLRQGVLMLLAFSLGLGLPFILSALLIDQLKGAFNFIKRNYRSINIISGGLLIVVGILMATGYMGYFLSLLTF